MNLDIPKNVRQALEKQPAEGDHPESELLNAYAERALSAQEDTQITGHLAACSECREVVFLAASAVERPAQYGKPEASEGRRLWWRWAMPATALLAIAVAFVPIARNDFSPRRAAQQNHQQEAKATP